MKMEPFGGREKAEKDFSDFLAAMEKQRDEALTMMGNMCVEASGESEVIPPMYEQVKMGYQTSMMLSSIRLEKMLQIILMMLAADRGVLTPELREALKRK